MGKMKEKFLEEQQQASFSLQDEATWMESSDEFCCGNDCGCHEEMSDLQHQQQEQHESNQQSAAYDIWWNDLSNDQKEKMFSERDESEKEVIDQMTDYWEKNSTNESNNI
jgi:N-acetyl-gamma-glutamylphosphate reductase